MEKREIVFIYFDKKIYDSQNSRKYLVKHKLNPVSRVQTVDKFGGKYLIYTVKDTRLFTDFLGSDVKEDIYSVSGIKKKIKKIIVK